MGELTYDKKTASAFYAECSENIPKYTDRYGMVCDVVGELSPNPTFTAQGDSAWRTGIDLICAANDNDLEKTRRIITNLNASWSGAVTDNGDYWPGCPVTTDSMCMVEGKFYITNGPQVYTYNPIVQSDTNILQNFDADPSNPSTLETLCPDLPASFLEGIDNICVLNKETYLIKGAEFIQVSNPAAAQPLSDLFKNLPTSFQDGFDSICVINSKVFITRSENLIIYTNETVSQLEGEAQLITAQWPALSSIKPTSYSGPVDFTKDLDAMCVIWGHLYVVKGNYFLRFDDESGSTFDGVPVRNPGCRQPYSDDQLVTQAAGLYYACKRLTPTKLHDKEQIRVVQEQAKRLLMRFTTCLIKNGMFLDVEGNRRSFTMIAPDSLAVFLKILDSLELRKTKADLIFYLGKDFTQDNQINRKSLPNLGDKLSNAVYMFFNLPLISFAQGTLKQSDLMKKAVAVINQSQIPGLANPQSEEVNSLAKVLLENLSTKPQEIFLSLVQGFLKFSYLPHDLGIVENLQDLCGENPIILEYLSAPTPQVTMQVLSIALELLIDIEKTSQTRPATLDQAVLTVMENFGKVTELDVYICEESPDHTLGYAAFLFFWKLILICEMQQDGDFSGDLTQLRVMTSNLYQGSKWRDMALLNFLSMQDVGQAEIWLSNKNPYWTEDKPWVAGGTPYWKQVDYAWQRTPSGEASSTLIPRLDFMTLYHIHNTCVTKGINLKESI